MTKPSNPNRTGGPKSVEGIARSASNALKTGFYSRMVVWPDEEQADFDRLLASFMEDFQPTGITEETLVRELAVNYWKKLRLERIDNAQYELVMDTPITEGELARVGFEVPKDFGWVLANMHLFTPGLISDFHDDIAFCERLLGTRASYEDFQHLKRSFPDLYQKVVAMGQEHRLEDTCDDTLRHLMVIDQSGQRVYATEFLAYGIVTGLREIIEAYEHRDDYFLAFKRVRIQRRIDVIASNSLGRTLEEQSRAFFRIMAELRKQQDWRRNRQVIDVTPVSAPKINKMLAYEA